MAKLKTDKWTVVQHSAYVAKEAPTFKQGLEIAKVGTDAQLGKIIDAGGVIFSDYASAANYEHREAYPEGYEGMAPKAPGTFNNKIKIDGAPIYIPFKKLPLDDDTLKTLFQYATQMGIKKEAWKEELRFDWMRAGGGTYFRGDWSYLQAMRNTPGMFELLEKLTYARLEQEMAHRGFTTNREA